MNIKVTVLTNIIFLTPSLSIGMDNILGKQTYWINISFLSFTIIFVYIK